MAKQSTILAGGLMFYIYLFEQLEQDYNRIPDWRFFKQQNNINQRGKLTKLFEQWRGQYE